VSSFGYSGTNAHLVIEEYRATRGAPPEAARRSGLDRVIVLSARSAERLRQRAADLLAFSEAGRLDDSDLADIAYTLQAGREPMPHRLALTATSVDQLRDKLRRYVAGERHIDDLHDGETRSGRDTLAAFAADEEMHELVGKWLSRGKHRKLLELWVKGLAIEWQRLYGATTPRRVSLPTYPFAQERYWIAPSTTRVPATVVAMLHPLVQRNTSDLDEQRFSSELGANGQHALLHLEMARAALELAAGWKLGDGEGLSLRAVSWPQPARFDGHPIPMHIALHGASTGPVGYEIFSEPEPGMRSIHGCGTALRTRGEVTTVDIDRLQAEEAAPASMVVPWGLPKHTDAIESACLLRPSALETVLQAAQELLGKSLAPQSLDTLELFAGLGDSGYALLRNTSTADTASVDVQLCDEHGTVCAALHGLAFAAAERPNDAAAAAELMILQERWLAQPPGQPAHDIARIVCFVADATMADDVEQTLREIAPQALAVCVLPGDAEQRIGANRYVFVRDDGASCRRVSTLLAEEHGKVDAVVVGVTLRESAGEGDWRSLLSLLQGLFASGLSCGRLLLCTAYGDALSRCHAESWIGIERSLGVLVPSLPVAVLVRHGALRSSASVQQWTQSLWQELRAASLRSVRHDADRRYVLQVQEQPLTAASNALGHGGVYWITGGAGGLGAVVARHLLERYAANVVLSGRRELDDARQAELQTWTRHGGEVLYVAADVADAAAMRHGVARAVERFGAIEGVFHAAGVLEAGSLLDKHADAFARVLAPKVRGTQVLDEVMQDQPLAFVCYFGSSAAVLGDFGSGDYALGNRFEMAYAEHVAGPGRRIAIDWPVWADGGMQVADAENLALYLQASGQAALSAQAGLDVLEQTLAQPAGHYLVMVGQRARIERTLGMQGPRENAAPERAAAVVPAQSPARRRAELRGLSLEDCVQWELKAQIGELLKLGHDQIHAQENLVDYGFDSILLAHWARRISQHYAIELTPAVFFSHPTLEQVVAYLLSRHVAPLQAFYQQDVAAVPVAPMAAPRAMAPPIPRTRGRQRSADAHIAAAPSVLEPIAIVGMSGRFAQARTVEEFWNTLVDAREAVTEIPSDRFDWRSYYDNSVASAQRITSKWLGAVPGVAEFDAAFFEISPREALGMDPRQRLLLQEAWNALEDAAYGQSQCTQQKIGVFVGAEQGEYQWLAGTQATLTGNHDAILASRLSYFLNLRGPVMALNTSCSSGLVAAHQACQSLRSGECDTAIAAGVNLMLTPHAYWGMSQAGMLSEDGRCYAFDRRANGLVPGEAVVAVVLKRLSRAQADGDPIRAVIVGSGINYDGHTNGITAPNGAAQAELIGEVYARSGIDARQIGYVVTHGTGTRLGDPVEVNALQEVFGAHTAERGFCALTSTKGNVGHTFAASGLVNLVCAVQALQHRQIPASLHCEEQSEYIDWERSAFHVNRQTRPWLSDGPRHAALSAFGMSGTNVHMVVREAEAPVEAVPTGVAPYWLLALSAKSAVALQQRLRDLSVVLRSREWDAAAVQSLGYTLLCGRQHFAHRCVIVAQDVEDALHLLARAEAGERPAKVFTGVVPREFSGQKTMLQYGQELIGRVSTGSVDGRDAHEALYGLADLYCQGYALPWAALFGAAPPRRMALPTYPFARDLHWVETAALETSALETSAAVSTVEATRRVDEESAGGIALVATAALAERTPRAARASGKPAGIALTRLTSAPARAVTASMAAAVQHEPVAQQTPPPAHPPREGEGSTPAAVMPTRIDRTPDTNKVQAELARTLADALYMDVSDVEPQKPFAEMGLDSIIGVEWVRTINRRYTLSMPAARIYDFPNVQQLAQYLVQLMAQRTDEAVPTPAPIADSAVLAPTPEATPEASDVTPPTPEVHATRSGSAAPRAAGSHDAIAIIGMSGRYPDAPDLDTF
ncbi:SDR family NAD(P)-dependent oxidoreductase, partial [Tahibacter sp.]|uniref:SDR family NAD(P)-dependent oxidoreductase n=1 Tax=Tahibacter sp. TaxID=2056211 RepID=UPI0028C50796